MFKARFNTPKQKAIWQKQLFDIKQRTDSIDAYVNRFRSLRRKVDSADVFPVAFVVQLFIQGLKPEYAVNVQASEPDTLDAAITTARRWETGRLMATANPTETDQAIKQLTDQIAQLSINLAQKTTPTTVNYADTPNQAPPIRQPPTCHYCGCTEHFIAKCNARRQDQQLQRSRQPERTS